MHYTREVLHDWLDGKIAEMEEVEAYGASLAEYRNWGVACPSEQKEFYQSHYWLDRAKVVRTMDRFTCRGCHRKMGECDDKLHVHHEKPIYSAYSNQFTKNFDSQYLKSLCGRCHDEFHELHRREAWRFVPADRQERAEDRSKRATMAKLHDQLRECPFCFRSQTF